MTYENFKALTKEIGLSHGATPTSFTHAVQDASERNGRVYFTLNGFQSDRNLKTAEKIQGVELPIETVKELAKNLDPETESKAKLLHHNIFKRFWIWLTGLPSADTLHQRIKQEVRQVLYPQFNKWAQRNIENGRPKFLDVVFREDIGDVRQAVDEILSSPLQNQQIDELFFDNEGRNPLHALVLNPQLEATTITRYMKELKRLDPHAEKLWLKKDNTGSSPLALAASQLNFAILDYLVHESELSADEVISNQDAVVLELLKCCLPPRLEEISRHLKLSNKATDPFQVKQRNRRMLVLAAENYPSLFKTSEVLKLLEDHSNEIPEDILHVCRMADELSGSLTKRKQGIEAWNEDCRIFLASLQGDQLNAEEKLRSVYQRIDDLETILPRRHTYLGRLSERNEQGLTVLQQKAAAADLLFFQDLCNPLRFFDHSVDYSNNELMRTTGGIHLLTVLIQQMNEKPEESLQILQLLLGKAPELVKQIEIGALVENAPESCKERLQNILDSRHQIVVETDQLLKTEYFRAKAFKIHLAYLNSILPELRGEQQLVHGEARLKRSPELLRKAEQLTQPKEKKFTEIFFLVLRSRKMILTVLSSLAKRIRAAFTSIIKPQKAQKIEAEALRTLSNVPHHIGRDMFGERLVTLSKNIGSKQVIDNDEDQAAAKKLYEDFVAKKENKAIHKQIGIDKLDANEMKWGFLASDPEGWKGIIQSGDCWGTVMDLIQFYHEKGFDRLKESAEHYSEGVPSDACANQALYVALQTFPDHPSDMIFAHLELLSRLDGMEGVSKQSIFNADFTTIQKLFATIMLKEINFAKNPNLFRNKEKDRQKLIEQIQRMNPAHPLVKIVTDRLKMSNRLMYDEGSNSVATLFDQLRADWETYVNTHSTMPAQWAVGLNTLTWLEGLVMQQVGCRKMLAQELVGMSKAERERQEASGRTIDPRFAEIPDPRLKAFLAQVDATQGGHRTESAVIAMRGLKQEAIHGLPERHVAPTDLDYLRRFSELDDGAYVISFSTHGFQADAAHSTGYFKQGEKGYIFDPNLGLIECLPGKHAEDLLKLLSLYSKPAGKSSHEMEILSVTLIS